MNMGRVTAFLVEISEFIPHLNRQKQYYLLKRRHFHKKCACDPLNIHNCCISLAQSSWLLNILAKIGGKNA